MSNDGSIGRISQEGDLMVGVFSTGKIGTHSRYCKRQYNPKETEQFH